MPKKSIIFIGASVLVLMSLLILLYTLNNTKTFPDNIAHIGFHRNYIPDHQIKRLSIQDCPKGIWHISFYDRRLYGQGWETTVIKLIDTTLQTKKIEFGRLGSAPGEFQQIDSYSFHDSLLSVVDNRIMRITEFNLIRQTVHKTVELNRNIFHGTHLSKDTYLFVDSISGEIEFYDIFNIKDHVWKRVSVPRIEKSRNTNAGEFLFELSGKFHQTSNQGIPVIQTIDRAGQFTAFDSLGQILYHKQTIDASPLPTIESKNVGGSVYTTLSKGSRTMINVSASTDKKYLYILSNAKSPEIREIKQGQNEIGVIDAYDIQNGNYVFSFKIPNLGRTDIKTDVPSGITIGERGIYVIQGAYICLYSFPH